MNWHERGDILEAHCRQWMQQTWQGCRIIETKKNSVHGIDFAVEDGHGDVRIVEVKSASGSLSDGQFTIDWIRDRVGSELYTAICRCVVRRRYLIRVLVRVKEHADGRFTCSTGSPTDQLTWEALFPGRVPPSLDMTGMDSSQIGDIIRIEHKMSGFGIDQIHIYDLPVNILSIGLRQVIIEQSTFPFIVPHAHAVVERGVRIYQRDLGEWDDYFSISGIMYNGSALRGQCRSCGKEYFHFENENYCGSCFERMREHAKMEKLDIIRQADYLANSTEWKSASEQFKALMERWKASGSTGRDQEEDLWRRFDGVRQRFFDHRQHHFDEQNRQREVNYRIKQQLVDDARHLAHSSDWKTVGGQQRELMSRWKATGPAGRDHDDALWQEFQAARQIFYDRQKKHFEDQERQREENRRIKQQLVDDARHLAHSSDWKTVGGQQRELMSRWKATGPAGRDHDDVLWQEFQAARQTFYDRQKKNFEDQELQRNENAKIKRGIISEAKRICYSSDWKITSDDFRNLMSVWKDTGSSGRDVEESLWQEFYSARQIFYDRQSEYFDERNRSRERQR